MRRFQCRRHRRRLSSLLDNLKGFLKTYPLKVIYQVDSALHPLNCWGQIYYDVMLTGKSPVPRRAESCATSSGR